MADNTKIEWTDATWNVITGCTIESAGCTNCYAMKLAGTRLRNHPSRAGLTKDSAAGPVWTGEVRFNEQWLLQPLRWRRPRLIFPAAHGDLFHLNIPTVWLDRVFAVMALSKQHTFQCLTKRPARAWSYLAGLTTAQGRARVEMAARDLGYTFEFESLSLLSIPLRNVLIGCSVENQACASSRRPPMSEIARLGWATWASYEPALGCVEWDGWQFLKWLVSGGESGNDARPSHPDWHRGARDFAQQHDIAYMFKQWGGWAPGAVFPDVIPSGEYCDFDGDLKTDDDRVWHVPRKAAGRLLDGKTHDGFPEAGNV